MKLNMILVPSLAMAANAMAVQPDPHETEGGHVHTLEHESHGIEEVVVRATPLQRSLEELSQSATVLGGANLQREASGSLGDTLARQPGLSNASFGQNVGRPVIRGMQGQRVGVLSNKLDSGDAAAVSQDHAVSIEPFLADQIEVLRGPSTLLYGSGAIGGVVNTVTHTIPVERPGATLAGRALVQIDSAADERFAAARLDAGAGAFAFHANGFYRRSDDYEIPDEAELYPGEEDHESGEDHGDDERAGGVLENSFLDNEGGSIGGAWIGDDWRLGLSTTVYDSNYGIPGAHHHHGEEAHKEEAHGDDAHEGVGSGEEEEEFVTIDLESSRWDAELEGAEPMRGFERLNLRLAGVDYSHTEFEGEETGTVFDSDTLDARLELRHQPWGPARGTFGFQYRDVDFGAFGEEAFVPGSNTSTSALFWVESLEFDRLTVDLGARFEDQDIRLTGASGGDLGERESRHYTPLSLSAGAVWHTAETMHLSFSLSRAERAPTAQELFAYGPHVASQTFEIGNPDLGVESNLHAEASYRVHGEALSASVTVYTDRFDDYIYKRNTEEDRDELPVRLWSQQDADFVGGEFELRYDIGHLYAGEVDTGHWEAFGFYDAVSAELDNGSRVPLMPPRRIGVGLDWHRQTWAAHLLWIHAARHDRVAAYETPTAGYDLLNLEITWLTPLSGAFEMEAFLNARNLLDEDVRNSTSSLKDQAPQAGRNFMLGLRARF
jgi:iron complex outermembrane receptor protein